MEDNDHVTWGIEAERVHARIATARLLALASLFFTIAFDVRRISQRRMSKRLEISKGLDVFGRSCYVLELAMWCSVSAALICMFLKCSFLLEAGKSGLTTRSSFLTRSLRLHCSSPSGYTSCHAALLCPLV